MKVTGKNLLLLFFLMIAGSLNAQQQDLTAYTNAATFDDSVFLNNCLVLVDSNHSISPEAAIRQNWTPLSDYQIKNHIPVKWITKRVYLKLNISNTAAANDSIYFFPGISFRSIRLFKLNKDNSLLPVPDLSREDGYQPLLIAGSSSESYIAELYFTKRVFNYLAPQLIKKKLPA